MDSVSPEKVAELKSKFPDRSLHLVELVIGGDVHELVMTGPSTDEYKKFTDEMLKAVETKDQGDRISALRGALMRGIMAQTRYPARDDVQKLFDFAPEAIDAFQNTLREHAGSNAEVRSKKL